MHLGVLFIRNRFVGQRIVHWEEAEALFTTPLDNALDRRTYFKNCWPDSSTITDFDFVYEMEDGVRVIVVYEGHTDNSWTFRNTELHTVWNGQLVATEVYFGWNLPASSRTVRHAAEPNNQRTKTAFEAYSSSSLTHPKSMPGEMSSQSKKRT